MRNVQGTKKKALHFFVKWKGYHEKDNTWKPLENVKNSQKLIDEFYKENSTKPKEKSRPYKKHGKVQVLQSGRSMEIDPKDFRPLFNDTAVTTWPGNHLDK